MSVNWGSLGPMIDITADDGTDCRLALEVDDDGVPVEIPSNRTRASPRPSPSVPPNRTATFAPARRSGRTGAGGWGGTSTTRRMASRSSGTASATPASPMSSSAARSRCAWVRAVAGPRRRPATGCEWCTSDGEREVVLLRQREYREVFRYRPRHRCLDRHQSDQWLALLRPWRWWALLRLDNLARSASPMIA